MSDHYADQVTKDPSQVTKDPPQPPQSFTILITMHPNQQVEVTGPLSNDVLCYGMLEKARAHIQNLHLKASNGPGQGIAGMLRKMGRG